MSKRRCSDANEIEETSTSSKLKKQKVQMTVDEYDMFLKEKKEGRFKRTGEWGGMHKNIQHECCDSACRRTWKPSPVQCMPDDYYCPSCVLHHRNNVNRFTEERLKWTAHVPNTFYVFSLTDPGRKTKDNLVRPLIKFGRTQHVDPLRRYPTAELKDYQMKLLLSLRGKLITMTKIENWWKQQAEENNWLVRFSNSAFHGQTECIEVDDQDLAQLIAKSKEMASLEEADHSE